MTRAAIQRTARPNQLEPSGGHRRGLSVAAANAAILRHRTQSFHRVSFCSPSPLFIGHCLHKIDPLKYLHRNGPIPCCHCCRSIPPMSGPALPTHHPRDLNGELPDQEANESRYRQNWIRFVNFATQNGNIVTQMHLRAMQVHQKGPLKEG